MVNDTQFFISDEHEQKDIEFVTSSLIAFNQQFSPSTYEPASDPVNLFIKDSSGTIYGGAIGMCYRYAMFIHILWVDEQLRGSGFGTKLLTEMETIAKSKDCNLIHLDTWSFQAPLFYQKQGFEIFGTLEGFQEGIKRYYLRKLI